MSGFLAIDPGGPCLGWAWYEGGLRAVGLSRTKAKTVAERARAHRLALDHYYPCRVVAERMVCRYGKADPQDLVDLNLIAGHLGTEWLTTQEWKGSIPKAMHQPRILGKLTKDELSLVAAVRPPSLRHNAIDAVGIALVVSGRLKGGSL